MPVILTNKTATIEIDITASLQHIVTKGSFDVTLLNEGNNGGTAMVWILFQKREGQINNNIALDWREISSPVVTSAEELRDLILSWNIPPVIVTNSSLPDGAATSAKQDLLLTELQKKADLTETQPVYDEKNDIAILLRTLLAAIRDPVWLDMATNAKRALLIAGSTTAVTGSLTSAGTITTQGDITNIGANPADQLTTSIMDTDWGVTTRNLLI